MLPPQNGRCGCPGGPRRGSPYQAPDRARRPADGPQRRTVATWTSVTSQEGTEAPRPFFSADPWARQPRVLASTPLDGVPEPFRGRTVREADEAADGACLQLPLGSRTCRGCGVLFVHRDHLRSANHVAHMAAAPPRDADAIAWVVARMAVGRRFAAAVLKAAPWPPGAPPKLLRRTSWPARSSLNALPRTRRRTPSQ
ncbi:hypothetical protein HPB47_017551 [Ixodes persulcatus]|uniref:Uncharacterized protein n=1 Tax=Ixodes persulcatus TaxID=34615 RepID=A0AC60QMZ5_IXOPE|nr:hypothetical protein HPB47_017551 [Ixodes persulcatus]